MATEGYVKFEYFSKGVPPYYNTSGFPELLDDEKITIETPCLEMNYHQYAGLFKKFLMAVGFDEKNVLQAGCSLAFSEMNREELMRQVAEEYDLVMAEDLPKLYEERLKQEKEWLEQNKPEPDIWEKRYWQLYKRFRKFAPFTDDQLDEMVKDAMPPWGHSDMEAMKYTDEELDAMCDHAEKQEENRKMTYDEAISAGWELTADGFWIREPKDNLKAWNGLTPGSPEAIDVGCLCPVMDNEEMPADKKWVDAECPIHGRKKND